MQKRHKPNRAKTNRAASGSELLDVGIVKGICTPINLIAMLLLGNSGYDMSPKETEGGSMNAAMVNITTAMTGISIETVSTKSSLSPLLS
jgi:hypothetical protein